MSEFIKDINEIKGDLIRNRSSPTMNSGRIALRLIQLIDVMIKENKRLNEQIKKLEQEFKTHTTVHPLPASRRL